MEYELIPIEAKTAGKSHVLMGTIVDTRDCDIKTYAQSDDKWVIRADVEIDGHGLFEDIPVFYHCQFSKTAGRAAFEEVEEGQEDDLITEGSPFIKDDRVVVLNDGEGEGLSAENLKIVAYEDGLPRQCVFQFRITRDDGKIADKDLLQPVDGISIYQRKPNAVGSYERVGTAHAYTSEESAYWTHEEDTWYYARGGPDWAVEFSYNEVTQIWTVPFHVWPNHSHKNNKDFFVFIYCLDSVKCMISSVDNSEPEYVYKTADFYQDEYAVVSKFYEAKAPYYKETYTTVRTSLENDDAGQPGCEAFEGEYGHTCYAGGDGEHRVTVQSSIEYNVNFNAAHSVFGFYYGEYCDGCFQAHRTCESCSGSAEESGDRWFTHIWVNTGASWEQQRVTVGEKCLVTTSNGLSSNNIQTSPIASQETIAPVPYSVEEQTFNIKIKLVGGTGLLLVVLCKGPPKCLPGTNNVSFMLYLKAIKAALAVSAAPKLT